jgi:glycosyltransferase involved in cell wall biosynthesis
MHGRLRVAAVVPARNEERLIGRTIWPVPEIIDTIYVIDDGSQDRTAEIVQHYADSDPRIRLISHKVNQGVGAAIITGYNQAYKDGHDVFVVVGGDAQMDWLDLDNLLQPIAAGRADYTKGNRFIYGSKDTPGNAWKEMPTKRILGNVCCSILTKIASGYYHLNDSQMGYTALHKRAFKRMDWKSARKGYGYPAEWLMRFHSEGVRVADVPVRAIYLSNERQTQIQVKKFLFYMMGIIVKGWMQRINREYLLGKLTMPTIRIPTISIPIRSVFQSIGARIRSSTLSGIRNGISKRLSTPSFFSKIRSSFSFRKSMTMNVSMSNPTKIENIVFDSSIESSKERILRLANKIVREQTLPLDRVSRQSSRIERILAKGGNIRSRLPNEKHWNDAVKRMRELVYKEEA